jgi:hypothetical protein
VLTAAVTALTILLLFFTESARAELNHWMGNRSGTVASRATTIRVLALLVIVALVFTLNPEVRAFLIFVDMLGVDVFLMLIFFQARDLLHWFHVAVALSIHRRLAGWGPYPMPLPHCALFRHHPWWGIYATVQPIVLGLMIVAVPSAIVFTAVRSLTSALNIVL